MCRLQIAIHSVAEWLAGWLAERLAALPSPPSLPHINQGLSERSIVGGAVRCKVSVPHSPPSDRPPSRAAARSLLARSLF